MRVSVSLCACLGFLWSGPVAGQELCDMTEDQANCTRVLACIGTDGRWFHGRAFGRGAGTLTGRMDDGVQCSGVWIARNVVGVGQADVTCSDGMTVRVIYYYQDEETGTARGLGRSNRGAVVKAWSGNHVLDYFRNNAPDSRARLICGTTEIPLS